MRLRSSFSASSKCQGRAGLLQPSSTASRRAKPLHCQTLTASRSASIGFLPSRKGKGGLDGCVGSLKPYIISSNAAATALRSLCSMMRSSETTAAFRYSSGEKPSVACCCAWAAALCESRRPRASTMNTENREKGSSDEGEERETGSYSASKAGRRRRRSRIGDQRCTLSIYAVRCFRARGKGGRPAQMLDALGCRTLPR